MTSPKQLRHIATNPEAYIRFQMTGKLPAVVRPASPLITLLEALTARERMAITGLKVNECLGYFNSRQFHTAEAALRWLKPASEMLESQSWPAESYRIKRFIDNIYLDALVANAARVPDGLLERHPRLRDPAVVRAECDVRKAEAHRASEASENAQNQEDLKPEDGESSDQPG